MHPTSPGGASAHTPAEPRTGNYFVSTYPPFSCWSETEVDAFRAKLGRTPPRAAPFGLYVHIPFCVERCSYCYYRSYDDRPAEISRYTEALIRELEILAATPALADRRIGFVYFGGGTPSLLSSSAIRRLVRGLQQVKGWADAEEVTFECAPRSVTRDKMRLLRDVGVTRLSLGVQHFDDQVLRHAGRVHEVRDVERALDAVGAGGFDVVNVDLMTGLPGETDDSFQRSVARTVERGVESVTVYQLEIPLNTPLYRALRDEALPAPLPSWEDKRARLGWAFARLEQKGYTVRSAYAAVRDPVRHRFVYQEDQYRGADLLGIGVSSFSYLDGVHQQNRANLRDYLQALAAGALPLGRAHALDDEERMVREFVLQLKLGGIARRRFRDRFGADPVDRFRDPLREFAASGWLRVDDERVLTTREGLLRIDRLLPAFYLPRHRGVRYS